MDRANSIIGTFDDGYICAGITVSNDGDASGNHGSGDMWIVKIDATGILEWQKCFGGSAHDNATSIIETSDGNYIFAGTTESNNGDITDNQSENDYWIVKLDTSGNILWQITYGELYTSGAKSIGQTADGGLIVAGQAIFLVESHPTYDETIEDIWLLKLDANGIIEWEKQMGITPPFEMNWYSPSPMIGQVIETNDKGFMLAGCVDSDPSLCSSGAIDYLLIKTDSLGNTLWKKYLGGSHEDFATSVVETIDGGCVIAGQSSSNDGDVSGNHGFADFWIVKLEEYLYPCVYNQFEDTVLCESDETTHLFVEAGGVSEFTYQWFLDLNLIEDETEKIISIVSEQSNSGLYSCVVTNKKGYTDTAYLPIQIYPIPEAFLIDGPSETYIETLEMYTAPDKTENNYTWFTTNGIINETQTAEYWAYVYWNTEGIGNVYAYATNEDGCSSDTVSLEVSIGVDGINSYQADNIKLYPNPANNKLYIDSDKQLKVEVYDNLDKKQLTISKKETDISILQNGIYHVMIKNNKGKNIKIQKLIIE